MKVLMNIEVKRILSSCMGEKFVMCFINVQISEHFLNFVSFK
jgi:hypothetical protein